MIVTPALNVAAGQRAGATLAELPPKHQHRQVVFEPELVVRRFSQARARSRG